MKVLNEEAYSLIGIDGNAFAIMGYVSRCMRRNKHSQEEIDAYIEDAKSDDYNHLLIVSMDMIEMLNIENGHHEGKQFEKPTNSEWVESKSYKGVGKSLNEGQNCGFFRGVEGVELIFNGEQSDPELQYEDKIANYWSVENDLWKSFLDETGHSDSESGDKEVENEFDEWCQNHRDEVINTVEAFASEKDLNSELQEAVEENNVEEISIKDEIQNAMYSNYAEALKPDGDITEEELELVLDELDELINFEDSYHAILTTIVKSTNHAALIRKHYMDEAEEVAADYAEELKRDILEAHKEVENIYIPDDAEYEDDFPDYDDVDY